MYLTAELKKQTYDESESDLYAYLVWKCLTFICYLPPYPTANLKSFSCYGKSQRQNLM